MARIIESDALCLLGNHRFETPESFTKKLEKFPYFFVDLDIDNWQNDANTAVFVAVETEGFISAMEFAVLMAELRPRGCEMKVVASELVVFRLWWD